MEPSIQFADQTAPSAQNNAQNNASTHNAIGGVVRLRSRTQSIGRKGSVDYSKSGEYEDAEDEDAGLRNEGDYKRSQVRAAHADAVQGVP
jgi:KUP system potassium uptake protein